MSEIPGAGSVLKLGATPIVDVLEMSWDNGGAEEQDATVLSSNCKKPWRSPLADFGSVNFKIKWDAEEATHQSIYALYVSGAVQTWTIVLVTDNNFEMTFSGFIKNFKPSGFNASGFLVADCELRVDSIVTIAA